MVRGILCPIIGNVSMDLTCVDVTNVSDVRIGDEAEIFGNHIPIEDLARANETIPYEILSRISNRVNRLFLHN